MPQSSRRHAPWTTTTNGNHTRPPQCAVARGFELAHATDLNYTAEGLRLCKAHEAFGWLQAEGAHLCKAHVVHAIALHWVRCCGLIQGLLQGLSVCQHSLFVGIGCTHQLLQSTVGWLRNGCTLVLRYQAACQLSKDMMSSKAATGWPSACSRACLYADTASLSAGAAHTSSVHATALDLKLAFHFMQQGVMHSVADTQSVSVIQELARDLRFDGNLYHSTEQTIAAEPALPANIKMRCLGMQHICTVQHFMSFTLSF